MPDSVNGPSGSYQNNNYAGNSISLIHPSSVSQHILVDEKSPSATAMRNHNNNISNSNGLSSPVFSNQREVEVNNNINYSHTVNLTNQNDSNNMGNYVSPPLIHQQINAAPAQTIGSGGGVG